MTIDTSTLRVEFGKYKGRLWTDVPVFYLKWMLDTPLPYMNTYWLQIAKAELDRRAQVAA